MSAVRIERLAMGGEGVGRLGSGKTVFVPRTAPGDLVKLEVVEDRPRYARARLVEVLERSDDRVEPECPHYVNDLCGGCQLQHVSLGTQHRAKRSFVGDAVRRIGKREVEDPEMVPSPRAWRYRNRITLRRIPDQSDPGFGFHRRSSPSDLFEPRDCLIANESVSESWKAFRDLRMLWPEADAVTVGIRGGERHVLLEGFSGGTDAEVLAKALQERGIRLWVRPGKRGARAEPVIGGDEPGAHRGPHGFEQVNQDLASKLRADAIAALGVGEGMVAWDLYCGWGEAAREMGRLGARVWAVDRDRDSIELARASQGPDAPLTFVRGCAEEVLRGWPEPDLVMMNPPRAGVDPKVANALESLVQTGRRLRMAYVSCDPATLARDLSRLPSFAIRSLTAYDLFPQTYHVETLAVLEGGP